MHRFTTAVKKAPLLRAFDTCQLLPSLVVMVHQPVMVLPLVMVVPMVAMAPVASAVVAVVVVQNYPHPALPSPRGSLP